MVESTLGFLQLYARRLVQLLRPIASGLAHPGFSDLEV